MEIIFKTDVKPKLEEIIEVYKTSGISRPIEDEDRIAEMYRHSNIIVTAWEGSTLAGIARGLSDFCYCCYLSDLAVGLKYQKQGIGKQLVNLTIELIGERASLILLAAPDAINYYPKIGFAKIENGYIIKRSQ